MVLNNSPIRFGLVGCGRISSKHSELIGGGSIPDAVLGAVCDIDLKKAKAIANKYNITAYDDMHQMMEKESLDVIVVLTESGNHAKHVVELAKYKKHIIVEKPMALNVKDAKSMIDACIANQIKLFVVKQNRYNEAIVGLKEAVDAGRFGKIFMCTTRVRWCRKKEYYDLAPWRGTWKLDGGVLSNQASHHLDLLIWLNGPVKSVFAYSSNAIAKIEAEDTAVAIVKFKNGSLGTIEATTAARPNDIEGSISVLGSHGSVEVAGFAANEIKLWKFKDYLENDLSIIRKTYQNPPDVYGYGHYKYYLGIMDSILNNKLEPVGSKEGMLSVELIESIYKSIDQRREILIEDIN